MHFVGISSLNILERIPMQLSGPQTGWSFYINGGRKDEGGRFRGPEAMQKFPLTFVIILFVCEKM